MTHHPSYLRVFLTFVRNSLVRDMMFPANFLIESLSMVGWMAMNVGFYLVVFHQTPAIWSDVGSDASWDKYQFFVFLATTMYVNGLMEMFFMPNAEQFSELIRTGNLDFALLKPIDTQFLISLQRVEWSAVAGLGVATALLGYAVPRLEGFEPSLLACVLYPLYIVMGVLIFYSIMVALAATSIWMGRNQSLYNFWFYVTNFSRYPMEIYRGPVGQWLRWGFTFILPVLIVVNVPARMMAKPLLAEYAYLAGFAVVATVLSLAVSRWVFNRALLSYRSASS